MAKVNNIYNHPGCCNNLVSFSNRAFEKKKVFNIKMVKWECNI